MSNKYKLTDDLTTFIGFGYISFHIDHTTREVMGLNDEDYPQLVDKWLKSGKIVEVESEEEVVVKEEETVIEEEETEDFEDSDQDEEPSEPM